MNVQVQVQQPERPTRESEAEGCKLQVSRGFERKDDECDTDKVLTSEETVTPDIKQETPSSLT